MSVKKTYSLSSTQQLIDLNGETTNFDLSFSVTSKGKQPFDLLVVDQSTLDNNPNLEFKRANEGSMSGNIISDKNIYQNYFLCLKSETPCEVDVTIDKKEISPNLQEPSQVMNGLHMQQVQQVQHPPLPYDQPLTKVPTPVQHQCQVSSSGTNWKMIFITVILVCGGLYLYYLYTTKNKDKSKKVNIVQESVIQPSIIQQISNTPIVPIAPVVTSAPIVIPSIPVVPVVPEVPIVVPSVPSAPTVPSVSSFGFTKRELDVQNMIARLNSLPTK
jgi:hypothetical protein